MNVKKKGKKRNDDDYYDNMMPSPASIVDLSSKNSKREAVTGRRVRSHSANNNRQGGRRAPTV